jgi:hypothetical protein
MILFSPKLIAISLCSAVALGTSDPVDGIWIDGEDDAVVRRTDLGNDAELPEGFVPIDLLRVQLQGWLPDSPALDPYTGVVVTNDADIMRMQVVVDGVVSPPGPLAIDGPIYNPLQYGDRPIYGYIEIDIDDQKNTGGELMPIARNRYLANVGRFGMSPVGSIATRIVRTADDLDSSLYSEPQFERTGGEFTLLLCGCFEPTILSQDGDMDSVFESGETWILSGRFFERFESFQDESGLFGGLQFGLFDPVVELQFMHNPIADETVITLVFPISNIGAAQLKGESVQPIDTNIVNHTSIEEALDDLIAGVPFSSGDILELVDGWEGADATDFRRPRQWKTFALVGTAPVHPDPSSLFVWTDVGFEEIYGDLNSDELVDHLDTNVIVDEINDLDGTSSDADGMLNGEVAIPDFGFSFNMTDLTGDGVIAMSDIIVSACPADLTNDGMLNFFDVSAFLSGFAIQDPVADFNDDGLFNFFDVSVFLSAFAEGCS